MPANEKPAGGAAIRRFNAATKTDSTCEAIFLPMTAKARAAIEQFETEQFALRDKVAALLKKLSSAQRLELMVSAGVLTKKGKLAPAYRPKRAAA